MASVGASYWLGIAITIGAKIGGANAHYWPVYFDTNEAIRNTFAAAAYPVPEAHFVHRTA